MKNANGYARLTHARPWRRRGKADAASVRTDGTRPGRPVADEIRASLVISVIELRTESVEVVRSLRELEGRLSSELEALDGHGDLPAPAARQRDDRRAEIIAQLNALPAQHEAIEERYRVETLARRANAQRADATYRQAFLRHHAGDAHLDEADLSVPDELLAPLG